MNSWSRLRTIAGLLDSAAADRRTQQIDMRDDTGNRGGIAALPPAATGSGLAENHGIRRIVTRKAGDRSSDFFPARR